jgi:hypothetical protein
MSLPFRLQENRYLSKKIGQALGAWPMPLNGASPVVPFFPSSCVKEAAREAAN